MNQVNYEIKYSHSSEFNSLNSYENHFKTVENNLRYDDPQLKDTMLDRSFKYANIAVLDMIDNFKNNFKSMFLEEHNMNAYTYYDKKNKKMMYDSFKLYDNNNNEVEYTNIFDENTLKKTKNVVSVIYKIGNDEKMFIVDHRHEEDNTFGFPSSFNSVPGGRRDSSNPLSTFFTEAHEELILGKKGIEFFDKSKITGYQLSENGVLFIFCRVNRDAEVNDNDENIGHSGFKPFSLTVHKNHEEFLKKEKELTKDQLKEYKKENSFKVLIPREQGKFDSVSSSFEEISFDKETLFGIPGRLDCYKKGSIIYNGLELIKNNQMENIHEAYIIGFLMLILNQEEEKIYFSSSNSIKLVNFNFKEKLKKFYGIDCMGYDGNIFFTCCDKKVVDKFYNYFHHYDNNKFFVNDYILNASAKFKKTVLKGLTVFHNTFDFSEDELKIVKKLVEGTDCECLHKGKYYKIIINDTGDYDDEYECGWERIDRNIEMFYCKKW